MEQPAASQFYLCFPNRAFARATRRESPRSLDYTNRVVAQMRLPDRHSIDPECYSDLHVPSLYPIGSELRMCHLSVQRR